MPVSRISNRWQPIITLCCVAALLAAGMPGKATFGGQHQGHLVRGACVEHKACGPTFCHGPSEHAAAHERHLHLGDAAVDHVESSFIGSSHACWACSSHAASATSDGQVPGASHGPACPGCPSCPTCPGCCHCSLAQVVCIVASILPVHLDSNLSSSTPELRALYSSPCHGRTTPPPKA